MTDAPKETRTRAYVGQRIRWTIHDARGEIVTREGIVLQHARWDEGGKTGAQVMVVLDNQRREFVVPVSSDSWKIIHPKASFIIEHPTRGVLKFFISSEEFGFSTTGARNDPERAEQFSSQFLAMKTLAKLPDKIKDKCDIRSSDDMWKIVLASPDRLRRMKKHGGHPDDWMR